MPKGGRLTVRISIVDLDEAHVQRHPEARVERFVCVSNTDTGCGIHRKISAHLEPFLPQKKSAKARAWAWRRFMALSNSTRAGLRSKALSAKARHSVFTFPMWARHKPKRKSRQHKSAFAAALKPFCSLKTSGQCGTRFARPPKIRLQNFAGRQWRRSPETWNRHKNEISMLFTDLVMPDNMNGRELAEKTLGRTARVKVIFTSGYSSDIVARISS